MKSLRIFPVIIASIILLAIFLPNIYKDIFANRITTYKVYYSPVEKDFIKMSIKKGKDRKVIYSNLDGTKEYSQDEYKAKLPFIFYSDLLKIGKFPQEFAAYAQDLRIIKREKSYLKTKPSMINAKVVNLYPLLESKPKYTSLKMPKDLFRLDEKGITFIVANTNSIDEEKSKLYTSEFEKLGAVFPLKEAYGAPTTRKPFDEGYFVTDSKNQLFHLKQISNEPFVRKVPTPNIETTFVLNKEDARKEYYGLVLDKQSNIYLLMYDDYELLKLPIKDFDYKTQNFRLMTTPINRIATIEYKDIKTGEQITKTYIMNLDYEITKENTFTYSTKQNEIYELAKSLIFPYKIYLISGQESYIDYEIRDMSMKSLVISFVLSLLYLVYFIVTKQNVKRHLIPAGLIAISGIYALIAFIIINKFLTFTNKIQKKENNEHV